MNDDAAELEAYRFLTVAKRRQLLFEDVPNGVQLRSSDKLGSYITFLGKDEPEALFAAVSWHAQNWTPFAKSEDAAPITYGLLKRATG